MTARKHTINLIKNKETVYSYRRVFGMFRLGVHAYLVIFGLATAAFFGLFMTKNAALDGLLTTKTQLLSQLQSTQNDEARLLLLSKKLNNYKQFAKDDAQFIPYYNLLLQALKTSSQSAKLAQFRIDKERNAQFAFSFTDETELSNSFSFIESPDFLSNFTELSLKNFSDTVTAGESRFELSFVGTFKKINEE